MVGGKKVWEEQAVVTATDDVKNVYEDMCEK